MKVLLVDDHPLFREGLALLLAPILGQASIAMAADAEHALRALQAEGDFDLVLMDLAMPGVPGLDCIRQIHEQWPRITVVALSSADDRDTVLRAIDAGAMGFIPKSSSPQVLRAALILTLDGSIYLPSSVMLDARMPGLPPPAAPNTVPVSASPEVRRRVEPQSLGLSPRQCDVARLVLQGKSRKLIQRELELSDSTVKQHITAVLRALNATNRTQAVVNAFALGLTFAPPPAPPDTQRSKASGDASDADTDSSKSEGSTGL